MVEWHKARGLMQTIKLKTQMMRSHPDNLKLDDALGSLEILHTIVKDDEIEQVENHLLMDELINLRIRQKIERASSWAVPIYNWVSEMY